MNNLPKKIIIEMKTFILYRLIGFETSRQTWINVSIFKFKRKKKLGSTNITQARTIFTRLGLVIMIKLNHKLS